MASNPQDISMGPSQGLKDGLQNRLKDETKKDMVLLVARSMPVIFMDLVRTTSYAMRVDFQEEAYRTHLYNLLDKVVGNCIRVSELPFFVCDCSFFFLCLLTCYA